MNQWRHCRWRQERRPGTATSELHGVRSCSMCHHVSENMEGCNINLCWRFFTLCINQCSSSNRQVGHVFFVGGFSNHPFLRKLILTQYVKASVNFSLEAGKVGNLHVNWFDSFLCSLFDLQMYSGILHVLQVNVLQTHFLKFSSHLPALGTLLNYTLKFDTS